MRKTKRAITTAARPAVHEDGFTLVELLVVISIIAILMGILSPVIVRIRRQAKILSVNAELRQIAFAIEMYTQNNEGKFPPTRTDCSLGWQDHQLPPELVAGRYLPEPAKDSGMSVGVEDRYNPGNTYKYWAVGELYQNNRFSRSKRSKLWIPDGFPYNSNSGYGSGRSNVPGSNQHNGDNNNYNNAPDNNSNNGKWYDNPKRSPVQWVLFSTGPNFDFWTMKQARYPVPKKTWYNATANTGLVIRMKLKKGAHVGSFER